MINIHVLKYVGSKQQTDCYFTAGLVIFLQYFKNFRAYDHNYYFLCVSALSSAISLSIFITNTMLMEPAGCNAAFTRTLQWTIFWTKSINFLELTSISLRCVFYGTGGFNAVFTRTLQWTISWAKSINFLELTSISLWSLVYGTGEFNAAFTRILQWTISLVKINQYPHVDIYFFMIHSLWNRGVQCRILVYVYMYIWQKAS